MTLSKKIKKVINSKEQTSLKLNEYCTIKHVCGTDGLGVCVDYVAIDFSITSSSDYTARLNYRDERILDEIKEHHLKAFQKAAEKLSNQVVNGYINGDVRNF